MDLLCRLCITEGHCGHILQDRHLHCAVPAIQQRHQGPGVHGPVHDGRSDACKKGADHLLPSAALDCDLRTVLPTRAEETSSENLLYSASGYMGFCKMQIKTVKKEMEFVIAH